MPFDQQMLLRVLERGCSTFKMQETQMLSDERDGKCDASSTNLNGVVVFIQDVIACQDKEDSRMN
jgi:hypothetical protein